MERFAVWEGYYDELLKKITTIQHKCIKFGCDFHFAEIGEEIREVTNNSTNRKHKCKFILIEVGGTAIINNWEFVAVVEHTEKGNIYSKALTEVEIPVRYRNSEPFCEHCHSNRERKSTCIIRNIKTGEFKQVGKACLNDFTGGMSATFVAWLASTKDIFKSYAEPDFCISGWRRHEYLDTLTMLKFAAETVRHFGYSKSENYGDSTKDKTYDFYAVSVGNTCGMSDMKIDVIKSMMKNVNFNANSTESDVLVNNALTWLKTQDDTSDYMHNLKTICYLDYVDYKKLGVLVSLFPVYDRALSSAQYQKAQAEKFNTSDYVGKIGDRISFKIDSIKCLSSWSNCFDGYHNSTTYLWQIVDNSKNVYTWKTSKFISEDILPITITGTVKDHKVFRDVKQTELTRCKLA